MNKTKSTLAQQTFEKVCAIETMLKAHLDGKPPAANTDKSALDKQPFLATAAPGEALAVIRLADAPDHLPCFDEADLLYGLRDIPVMMSYCPDQVLKQYIERHFRCLILQLSRGHIDTDITHAGTQYGSEHIAADVPFPKKRRHSRQQHGNKDCCGRSVFIISPRSKCQK